MATQIRRSDRRNLEAVRVRAPRRRNDRSQHQRDLHLRRARRRRAPIYNGSQSSFFTGASSGSYAIAMPGVGLEYRYPFVSSSLLGQQIIEPIAQLIVRPNEVVPKLQPNEDAQSLVFDETNLFAWDKYSGYDRVEGGTRLNYGMQYTANFANGGHANFVGGQSIQLAGQNSYTIADAANTGLESGLDKTIFEFRRRRDDRAVLVGLLAHQQAAVRQHDLRPGAARRDRERRRSAAVSANVDYGRYAAQPLLGWHYHTRGRAGQRQLQGRQRPGPSKDRCLFDMSRQYYDVPGQTTPLLLPDQLQRRRSPTATPARRSR